jgi:hypothetical protein
MHPCGHVFHCLCIGEYLAHNEQVDERDIRLQCPNCMPGGSFLVSAQLRSTGAASHSHHGSIRRGCSYASPRCRIWKRSEHLMDNFQKCSGVVVFILTWKCASRHIGVHFFDI